MKLLRSAKVMGTIVAALAFVSQSSLAQDAPPPKHFEAWTYACADDRCSIRQGLSNPANPSIIYGVVLSLVENNPNPIMRLKFPLGLYLPSGIGIQAGEMKLNIPLTVCLPTGCDAIAVVNKELKAAMSSRQELKVRFYTTSKTPKEINFSLLGFNAAYDELVK